MFMVCHLDNFKRIKNIFQVKLLYVLVKFLQIMVYFITRLHQCDQGKVFDYRSNWQSQFISKTDVLLNHIIEMTVKIHHFFRLHGNGILNCFYNNNVSLSNSSYDFKTDKYIWMIVVLTVTQNIGRLKKMIDFFL